ncbi:MAG: hypothetical protein NVSMB6_17110 [Burkholderiaceae bacterium]
MHTIFTSTMFRSGFLLAMSIIAGDPALGQEPAQSLAHTLATSAQTLASPTPVAAGGFYENLGGKQGIDAIAAEYVRIMTNDPRVKAAFEGVDLDRLRAKLAEQFCEVSGGPCRYSGRTMVESHEDLKTTNAQFNAAVEILQLAMTRNSIPSRVQNRLLGKLAPTQRDIVTK